jgi:haloacetate dehalogenase
VGHDLFDLVGHDRGSYYALRLALDRPKVVRKLALLDCLPICEHIDRADARFATRGGIGSSSLNPRYPNG